MSLSFAKLARLVSVTALFVTLALTLGACGDDISGRVACTSASSCGDPTDLAQVECCGGYCVGASTGCASGYRYITSEPEYGECVETSMCAATADLSVTADLSKPNDAGK